MLKYRLCHPEILAALGKAGHGSLVLIADGNYPFVTASHPQASRVYLNLAPGLVNVPDVLKALTTAIPIEQATVMQPDAGPEPAIFNEFRAVLGEALPLQPLGRHAFYDAARSANLALVVATGEQRIYANLLLTIGVVSGT